MADRAKLREVSGGGYVEAAASDGILKRYKGTFAYRMDDEGRIMNMFRSNDPVEFQGAIWDGGESRRMRIKVLIRRHTPFSGLVLLTGTGSPYE